MIEETFIFVIFRENFNTQILKSLFNKVEVGNWIL
jgi:hypothetical protein